jgi:hypothetical protein
MVPERPAGYSGTPLARKLGIAPGGRLRLVAAPEGFAIPDLPDLGEGPPWDVIVAFATTADQLESHLALRSTLDKAGGLWICWPKKASGVPTELTEDRIRERALATELVDNKVCAVDATWSALRLVIRRERR